MWAVLQYWGELSLNTITLGTEQWHGAAARQSNFSDWQGLWECPGPALLQPFPKCISVRVGNLGPGSRVSVVLESNWPGARVRVRSTILGERRAQDTPGACVSGIRSQRGAVAIEGRISSQPARRWRLVQPQGLSHWRHWLRRQVPHHLVPPRCGWAAAEASGGRAAWSALCLWRLVSAVRRGPGGWRAEGRVAAPGCPGGSRRPCAGLWDHSSALSFPDTLCPFFDENRTSPTPAHPKSLNVYSFDILRSLFLCSRGWVSFIVLYAF